MQEPVWEHQESPYCGCVLHMQLEAIAAVLSSVLYCCAWQPIPLDQLCSSPWSTVKHEGAKSHVG